ncbi:hypothetical protein [Sphingomonas paucimobilis]
MKSKRDDDPVTYSSDSNSTMLVNHDSGMDISDHDNAVVSHTDAASSDSSSVIIRPVPGGATVDVTAQNPNGYVSFNLDLNSLDINTVELKLKWPAPYGVPGDSTSTLSFKFEKNAPLQGQQYFGSGGSVITNGQTDQQNNKLMVTFTVRFPQ